MREDDISRAHLQRGEEPDIVGVPMVQFVHRLVYARVRMHSLRESRPT